MGVKFLKVTLLGKRYVEMLIPNCLNIFPIYTPRLSIWGSLFPIYSLTLDMPVQKIFAILTTEDISWWFYLHFLDL